MLQYCIKSGNNFKFQVRSFLLKIHVLFWPRGRHWLKPEPTRWHPKDVPIPKQWAEGSGQVPGVGGGTIGFTAVYFDTLIRGWGHPSRPGRSSTSEGTRERRGAGVPRTPTLSCRGGGVWGAAINTIFRKGKIQKVERKGKYLKAWGLKPHSTSLLLPLNRRQCLWSLHV